MFVDTSQVKHVFARKLVKAPSLFLFEAVRTSNDFVLVLVQVKIVSLEVRVSVNFTLSLYIDRTE